MHGGDSQFGTLNDGLRVRMLTGWVHRSAEDQQMGTVSGANVALLGFVRCVSGVGVDDESR
jgi:hypothetical protein